MSDSSTPCINLPQVPKKLPTVKLPTGVDLTGYADISLGTPSKCSLTFNLLAQLAPLLGVLQCLSHILKIIIALKDFASNPLLNGPKLLEAMKKSWKDIVRIAIPQIGFAITIKGTMQLIEDALDCLVDQLQSLVEFQEKIETNIDDSNPILTESLNCARRNLSISMNNIQNSLQPISSTLVVITDLIKMAEIKLPVEIPNKISINVKDPAGSLKILKDIRDTIGEVNNRFPE